MAPPPKKHNYSLPLLLLLISLTTILIFTFHSPTPTPTTPTPSQSSHFLYPTPTPTPTPTHPTPSFTLTIKLLTYNRPTSLTRSLTSLSTIPSPTHPIHLHIYLDHPTSGPTSPHILNLISNFSWPHGHKLVHFRSLNVGLQAQWIEAWWPTSDHDFAFVVEDDVEVSPLYYHFLERFILEYYYNDTNYRPWVFGASLQRPRFVPGKHGNKMKLDSETKLFLYPLVGTWGQLLFPRPWKEFRLWYDDHKARDIKPFLDGMVTTGWYKKMGERIWTPWFIKFIHSRGYFNFYTNFPHERALSVSHRDAGVNYGKTAGPDSELIGRNSLDISHLDMQPLSNLRWYDFCFREVLPGRVAKEVNQVGPILQSMRKQKPVLLVSLLKASEPIVRNLICHLEKLNIQNYIFMVPKSNSDLLIDLGRRGHPVIDTENVYDSITKSQKTSSDTMKDIMVKACVIKKCLEAGVSSWVIDWNILLLSENPLLESTDSEYDFYAAKGSGFFIAKSSSSSLRIWNKSFLQKFDAQSSTVRENENFADVVSKFSKQHGLRLKIIDDSGFSLKLQSVQNNQSLPENTKVISWSPQAETDSIHKRLDEVGKWIIDGDSSCKAVICHQS